MARLVEYLRADGVRSRSRADALVADPAAVVAQARQFSSLVPARFFLGTAQHESNLATNEEDTEESGFISTGIYQLSTVEKVAALLPQADLTDLVDSTQVFSSISEVRLRALALAAGFDVDAPPVDAWAYLAISHNQGLGAALKTIRTYGLDWAAYRARNPNLPIVAHGYGDDVITGGQYWRPEFDAPPDDGGGAPPGSSGLGLRAALAVTLLAGLFFEVL